MDKTVQIACHIIETLRDVVRKMTLTTELDMEE